MKPLGIKNYGSIPHLLGSKKGATDKYIEQGQHRICTAQARDEFDVIIATEKYDGSNVGVCKSNGNVYALNKAGYLASSSPYKMHHVFDAFVKEHEQVFKAILKEGERVCGEWLHQVHSLQYNLGHGTPFVPFDLFSPDNTRFPFDEFMARVSPYFNPARLVHCGAPIAIEAALEKLNKRHHHPITCLDSPEGVVYRVERKGKVDFLAKYVRADFEPGKYIINKAENDFIYNF